MWMGRKRDKGDRREWKRADGGVFWRSWELEAREQAVECRTREGTWKGATALHWRNTSKGLRLY